MTNPNPTISEFHLQDIDHARLSDAEAQVSFSVELEHEHITQRIMLGLLDETGSCGAAISIYPATGEVCDLTNDGGVIGYLSNSPFAPRTAISCEIDLYRFGQNWVCNVRIDGETFLYPGFMMDGEVNLTAVVGGGTNGAGIQWDENHLTVSGAAIVAA